MKKRKFMCMVSLVVLLFSACGIKENKADNGNSVGEMSSSENPQTDDSEEKEKEKMNTVSIYHVDDGTGELMKSEVMISDIDAQEIWIEVQRAGIVGEDEKVLGIEIADDNSMILDLNKEFGEHLRSEGTTGEKAIIDSIVNTYLEAFACERIKLTEEGGTLYSGHKEYDAYLEKK